MFAVSDCFQVKLTKLSTEYDYYYQLLNTGQLNKIEMFMTCTYKLGSDFTKLALLFIFSAFVLCLLMSTRHTLKVAVTVMQI